jgi:hypothetical protein
MLQGVTDTGPLPVPPLRGHQVEAAAVTWVLQYERQQGRVPSDKRYLASYPADIESPPRMIEIKATASSYRGWFLPVESVQLEQARTNPDFYIYVVENVGQGDAALFTLRILSGDHLRRLVERATERRYFEVPWPTADYLATPIEPVSAALPPDEPSATSAIEAQATPPVADGDRSFPARTVADAIREALTAHGGEATISEVWAWVSEHYPGRWKGVDTAMADLAYPGSVSSPYGTEARFLVRVAPGRYRLRQPADLLDATG